MKNIYVEGDGDENFVATIISHFNLAVNNYKIIPTNGWEKVNLLKNSLQQNKDLAGTNHIIFDADQNPAQRRAQILALINTPGLIDDIFLFPDNVNNGNLETLLLQVMNPANTPVNTCFDTYKLCIGGLNGAYVLPDNKTKVFAYLSVLGKEYGAKERNYADVGVWDLNHPLIQNFVNYLSHILN